MISVAKAIVEILRLSDQPINAKEVYKFLKQGYDEITYPMVSSELNRMTKGPSSKIEIVFYDKRRGDYRALPFYAIKR